MGSQPPVTERTWPEAARRYLAAAGKAKPWTHEP